jgi:hypothetical protein
MEASHFCSYSFDSILKSHGQFPYFFKRRINILIKTIPCLILLCQNRIWLNLVHHMHSLFNGIRLTFIDACGNARKHGGAETACLIALQTVHGLSGERSPVLRQFLLFQWVAVTVWMWGSGLGGLGSLISSCIHLLLSIK